MFKISCNLKDNRTFYEYLGRWFNMDHTKLTWLASSAQAVDQHGSCWIKIAKKNFLFISFGALVSLLASFLNYSSHLKHTHKFYKQNKIKIQSSNDLSLIINWVEMTNSFDCLGWKCGFESQAKSEMDFLYSHTFMHESKLWWMNIQ